MPRHALRDFHDHTTLMQFLVDAAGERTTSRRGMIVVWCGGPASDATQRFPAFCALHDAPKVSNALRNHISKRRNPSVQNRLVVWLNFRKRNSGAAILPAIGDLPEGLEDLAPVDDLNPNTSPRRGRESRDDPATKRTQVLGSLRGGMVRVEIGYDRRSSKQITGRARTLDPHRAFSRLPASNNSHLPERREEPMNRIVYCRFFVKAMSKSYSI